MCVICGRLLRYSLATKLPKSNDQKQRIKSHQPNQNSKNRQMRELRHKRSTQPLTRIHKRIYQYDLLKNRKVCESTPWVIRTAKENHWRQDHAEHQSDLSLANTTTKRQTAARRQKRHQ